MSRQESFQRQRAIIGKLSREPSTFQEIQDYLQLQQESTGDRRTCTRGTFHGDINENFSLHEIDYDKSSLCTVTPLMAECPVQYG